MTAQLHERLSFDGEETSMAFCPPLPADHPRIIALDPDQAARDEYSSILFSTACWRGYQGKWEIKDGRFYLVALRGRFRLTPGEPVLADWFSGVIRIPRGELLQYVHMGFGSVYEEEVHVRLKRGIVVASRTIDNRGKKHDQWELGLKNLPGSENSFPGDDEL
jgi:hypothetical protein